MGRWPASRGLSMGEEEETTFAKTFIKKRGKENGMCCVVENDGEKCGHKITGKNTTNLKRHLKAFHNEIEVSRYINITLLSILECSCQLMRLWLLCLILRSLNVSATGAEND